MKLGGSIERIELIPENDQERGRMQLILDGSSTIFWGDSDEHGGALVISTAGLGPCKRCFPENMEPTGEEPVAPPTANEAQSAVVE